MPNFFVSIWNNDGRDAPPAPPVVIEAVPTAAAALREAAGMDEQDWAQRCHAALSFSSWGALVLEDGFAAVDGEESFMVAGLDAVEVAECAAALFIESRNVREWRAARERILKRIS